MACPPAALSCSFHADSGVMDQSGRAMVCQAREKAAPSRCSCLCAAARSRYPRLHRSARSKSQALQMDQICRPNPGFGETLPPYGAMPSFQDWGACDVRRISSAERPSGEVGRMSPIPKGHCQRPAIEVKPKIFNQVTVTVEEEYGAHR